VIPPARPPSLTVTPLGEDGVEIQYDSERRLCALLRGLATGTAIRYGEEAEIVQRACMHRGDPSCLIDIRLSPAD
jgi:hypothetical protein